MIKSVAAFAVLALASAMPAHAQGNAYPLGLNWSSGWSGYGRPIVNQTVIVQVGDRKSSQVVSVDDTWCFSDVLPDSGQVHAFGGGFE